MVRLYMSEEKFNCTQLQLCLTTVDNWIPPIYFVVLETPNLKIVS
jgi:hypothetical protein